MKSLTASFFLLLFTCVLLQSCSIQPEASGRDVLSSPAQALSLEEFVQQTYTKPSEYEVDGVKKVSRVSRDEVNRFRSLGPVRTTNWSTLWPDSAFCNHYLALSDGTYCYRDQPGESFQIRRVDAFSTPEAQSADQVLGIVLGRRYRELRPLLFLHEYIETPRIRCVSFWVNQIQISLKDFIPKSMHAAPYLYLYGLGCLLDGKPHTVINESSFYPGATSYEVWDLFTHYQRDYLLVRAFHEDGEWFEVFGVEAVGFSDSREFKGLSNRLHLDLYVGPDLDPAN